VIPGQRPDPLLPHKLPDPLAVHGGGPPGSDEIPPVVDASVGEEPALAGCERGKEVDGEESVGKGVAVEHVEGALCACERG
jgi:hypothetical protein